MKKVFILLKGLAILIILGFTSCGKDYTCTCTFTPPTPPINIKIYNATQSTAQNDCNADQATYLNATCKLN